MAASAATGVTGPELFARFAYPPNLLGYCGPSDGTLLGELVRAGREASDDLRRVAGEFAGAWPYLELIGAIAERDPLDATVVEAYWIGHPLLSRMDKGTWGNSVDERFRRRAGWEWPQLSEAIARGGVPNHAFHVFCIYPWVGLLRSGATDQALHVLDRCRIRWGRVVSVSDGAMEVRSQRLNWDGRNLALGAPRTEIVERGVGSEFSSGDDVALHWDYACGRLSSTRLGRLRRWHNHHLAIANAGARELGRQLEN
ncbi:MAG: DUF6390 family protein [Acidimicrobiia bacterium]